jgi:putative ABC transport system permease protein
MDGLPIKDKLSTLDASPATTSMFRNFLKIAVRNLLKRKGFTLINILGLATGMAVCLLIVLFIRDELNYDNFFDKGDRIYRVVCERHYPGRVTSYALIPLSIGEAIGREFPSVEQSTRLFNFLGNGNLYLRVGDKTFEESQVLGADSNFFKVFSCPLLEGDPLTALQKPNTVVLNESTARRFFGSVSGAMGKTIQPDGGKALTVSGVCRDLAPNSHLIFDLLVANAGFPNKPNYIGFSAYTYLLLNKNASYRELESKLPRVVEKYVAPEIDKLTGQSFNQYQAAGNGYRYLLQPLPKIHLGSDLDAELRPNGSLKAVYIFGVIAIVILVLACINFINLSTARSVERAKEVGIRKTFGSGKNALVNQFLLESIVVSLLGLVVALGLIAAMIPVFNKISGKDLSMLYFLTPLSILILTGFAIAVGLVAGFYPALVLSSFKPILVLKGKFKSTAYGVLLRNGLVVFQFAISVILIICTLTVNLQMKYVLGDKLGFKKDHLIVVQRADLLGDKTKAFGDELAKIGSVETVSSNSSMPGVQNFFGISFQVIGAKEPMTGRGVIVDEQYAKTLDLQMKEGRFFSRDFATDTLALVLNEKAVDELGLKDPIGARLTSPDPFVGAPDGKPYVYTVVGVLRDFHYQSLHQKITPLIFMNTRKFGNVQAFMAVRIKGGGDDFSATLQAIGRTWKQFVPEKPFHYEFLDQNLAEQYKAEQTMRSLFTIFSLLAIFIACIGLLGLAAYATQQRMKEIGIRKVLGAGTGSIITMLSGDFLKLIAISALLAFPLAWWAMHVLLQDFAYRIDMPWWAFPTAGGLAAFIALGTISFQAIQAALTNPVTSLRSE